MNLTTASIATTLKEEQAVSVPKRSSTNMSNNHHKHAAGTNGGGSGSNHGHRSNNSNHNAGGASTAIGTKPTLIEVSRMRFLIMDAPRQANLQLYIREMQKHQVTHVVRVCEPTYVSNELENAGICLHEMEYKDGTSPSAELIQSWLALVDQTFYSAGTAATNGVAADASAPCIAVHCVAGLGRAPVLVAIALIEFANMDPVEAVSFLREKRRGAINEKQLLYLGEYKKQYKKKANGGGGKNADANACCIIL